MIAYLKRAGVFDLGSSVQVCGFSRSVWPLGAMIHLRTALEEGGMGSLSHLPFIEHSTSKRMTFYVL